MSKRRVNWIVLLLLLTIFLLAPIYESIDHWDGFPRSGNDTALDVIATVTFWGAVLVAGRDFIQFLANRRPVKNEKRELPPPPILFVFYFALRRADESPPLPPLTSLRV